MAELREIELGRLALLESALQPVVRQAPPGIDLFDLSLARGDRPRVFLDMVAFIEMARDRRTYRFFQDTVYGRVLIAESPKIDTIVAACTNYVARRLIERQRALTTGGPLRSAPVAARTRLPGTSGGETAWIGEAQTDDFEAPPPAPLERADFAATAGPSLGAPVGLARRLVAALKSPTTLGAITLVGLLALASDLAWTHRLHDFLTRAFGAQPF